MDFFKRLEGDSLSSFLLTEGSRKRRRERYFSRVWPVYCWLLMLIIFPKIATAYSSRRSDTYPLDVKNYSGRQNPQSGFVRNNRVGGNWGSWGSWSHCSRPCGTGVQSQTRECVTTRGSLRKRSIMGHNDTISVRPSCLGIYKRYHICNTQDCPNFFPDVRTQQCSKYNGKLYKGRVFAWTPFLNAPNSCALNCQAIGERFYATLEPLVSDGTHCRPNFLLPSSTTFGIDSTQWLCVAGHCKSVGCDGIIDSGLILDSCGICGGGDKACRWYEGIFVEPILPKGYHPVATIPKGAMSLNISELRFSGNFLALRDQNGDYILNGPWSLNPSGFYEVAGITLLYERGDENQVEYIQARGPLNESLHLEILFNEPNPGILYKYTLMKKESPESSSITLAPSIEAPVSLSRDNEIRDATTVEGVQETTTELSRSSPLTYQTQTGSENDKRTRQLNAAGTSIPPTTSVAGDQPNLKVKRRRRKFEWKLTSFSSCSKPCGGGFQKALFQCFRKSTDEIVDDRKCRNITKPVGPSARCNDRPCAARWRAESWSECSVTCGPGVRTRKVECIQKVNSRLTIRVAAGACIQPPDLRTWEACTMPACKPPSPEMRNMNSHPAIPKWEVGLWSPCSVTCGRGIRIRNVTCLSINKPCLISDRPGSEEFCEIDPCPVIHDKKSVWLVSNWSSKCSAECGSGVETRQIFCSIRNETSCDWVPKPLEARQCFGTACNKTLWFTGSWTSCSANCGIGVRKREVICISNIRNDLKIVSDSACNSEMPIKEEECRMNPCSAQWFTSDWSECSVTCGSGIRNRLVSCMSEGIDSNNCIESAKPRDKRLCIGELCRKSETSTLKPNKNIQNNGMCVDEYPYCELVLKADLCRIKYYKHSCCGCHS